MPKCSIHDQVLWGGRLESGAEILVLNPLSACVVGPIHIQFTRQFKR